MSIFFKKRIDKINIMDYNIIMKNNKTKSNLPIKSGTAAIRCGAPGM